MAEKLSQPPQDDVDFQFGGFHNLMPHRIQNVLLVSSLYESFVLEEDGLVTELITSEYLNMNLSHPPHVRRVSTGGEALSFIQEESVDLVITMTRLSHFNVSEFARKVKEIRPELPVAVLVVEPRDLRSPYLADRSHMHGVFVWNGNTQILLAIIKSVEDFLNVDHDTRVGNVRVILLVENSIRFYSTYLPLIYTEVMKLTQSLLTEGINLKQRLLRMRARPKILLAKSFEEAWDLYTQYSKNLLGIISDIRFPKGGERDPEAGLELTRRVRNGSPHMPVLLQSSEVAYASRAAELGAAFLHKESPTLLHELRNFILGNLGFGDFVFTLPDGTEVGRAHDLRSLEEMVTRVPEESISFHGRNNHFSNWLMARTEFEIADRIRPRKVSDFKSLAELRTYLLDALREFRERSSAGVVADFSTKEFDVTMPFTRIGGGSMGGKARGLAFVSALIRHHQLRYRFENVRIAVPNSATLGTNVFDTFLEENKLQEFVTSNMSDNDLVSMFLKAPLPEGCRNDLMTFLRSVKYPLAVRSSSLLEDAQDLPLAGIYATHMIPNNHPHLEVRLDQLCHAIKLVYMSTFRQSARRHLEATGHRAEEEKMAVILQEIVGNTHGGRFYPTFSGVARSYNFYPSAEMRPEDGIACVALGLGKIIVEGGNGLLFSPAHPKILPQFPTPEDMLANSQREFIALDIRHPGIYATSDTNWSLLRCGLDVAEQDGTLTPIGSVYSSENDMVYDGIYRPGPRLVTFAHVLKSDLFPLAEALQLLLQIGQDGMACPVEIEFAVNMETRPMQFGFLQIRPFNTDAEAEPVRIEEINPADVICYSPQALGNGQITDITDIIYVRPDTFDSIYTSDIAEEISRINEKLRQANRFAIVIGPGRWGTADRWLGIPVAWEQISQAKVIVETSLKDFMIAPSQGAHFFQNLTTLRVGYLTVNPNTNDGFINWNWLSSQASIEETRFLRHLRLADPLAVRLDGRGRRGVILKPAPHSK